MALLTATVTKTPESLHNVVWITNNGD